MSEMTEDDIVNRVVEESLRVVPLRSELAMASDVVVRLIRTRWVKLPSRAAAASLANSLGIPLEAVRDAWCRSEQHGYVPPQRTSSP